MTSQTIRALRETRGLTQEELAREAGVTTATVYRVESGRTDPSERTRCRIADVLGVPAEELFVIHDEADPNTISRAYGDQSALAGIRQE